MNKTLFEMAQALGLGKPWAPSGSKNYRLYINGWADLIGVDISYYKTGNVSGFSIDGVEYANSKGADAPRKIWIDQSTDEINTQGLGPRFPLDDAEICDRLRVKITEMYTKAHPPKQEEPAPEKPKKEEPKPEPRAEQKEDLPPAVASAALPLRQWAHLSEYPTFTKRRAAEEGGKVLAESGMPVQWDAAAGGKKLGHVIAIDPTPTRSEYGPNVLVREEESGKLHKVRLMKMKKRKAPSLFLIED